MLTSPKIPHIRPTAGPVWDHNADSERSDYADDDPHRRGEDPHDRTDQGRRRVRQRPLHGRSGTRALTSITTATSFVQSWFSPAHRTGSAARYAPPGPAWRTISRHTTKGLRPIKRAIRAWDKPASSPAMIAARSWTPSIRRQPTTSLPCASSLHEHCLHPMRPPT